MNTITLEIIGGTPIFTTSNINNAYFRVYGAVNDKKNSRWLFPAYPPFADLVIKDLHVVNKNIVFTEIAQQHIDELKLLPNKLLIRDLPTNTSFVTKPFEHQIEGLSYLYHHPRFGLFWDPGCGKTKVIIDLKQLFPNKRMLVIGPKVTVSNWVKEALVHGGPNLRAIGLRGTAEQKRDALEDYRNYDIIVVSYGTVRTMGVAKLHTSTLKHIVDLTKHGFTYTKSGLQTFAKHVKKIGDSERQAAYVLAWALGMSLADIGKYATSEATKQPQWLEDLDYDIIVADESHNIKELSSQQTKAALAISKKASRRYILSGTPTMGDPRHLYSQLRFLSPTVIPEDWFKFCDNFLVRSPWNKRIITGFKNLHILNSRCARVSISKKKEECLDLPERRIVDISFKLTDEQTKLYNELVSNMNVDLSILSDIQNNVMEVQNAATLLNKLAQITSGFILNKKDKLLCNGCVHLNNCVRDNVLPYTKECKIKQEPNETLVTHLKENPKLDLLSDLLDTLLVNPDNKVIIWGLYTSELNMIEELLLKRDVEYVRVDGATKGDIQQYINKFNESPNCKVYLSQVATGVGITLNAASYMIYFSLGWSLGTYLQSIDRNYRAGQDKKVVVYRLLGEKTIDGYKALGLDIKKNISSTLTNKLTCVTCPKNLECLKADIELFDEGCMYKRTTKKVVAHAKVIE